MSIETMELGMVDVSPQLSDLAAGMAEAGITAEQLDRPMFLTQETRHELPPLTDETRDRLEEGGYPDSVLDAIGSEAEAWIYIDAGLEADEVNGKDALIRTDIDYDKTDALGQTNLERMEEGRPPLDKTGRPIELHHIGQKPDSPLAELTPSEHRGNGNDNILHDKIKETEIDRTDFGKEREQYWKARADQVHAQR